MNQPLPSCLSDIKTQFDELCGDADKIIEKYKNTNDMEKTKKCCIGACQNLATVWKGELVKSRDRVVAGFCENHKDTKCPNAFGKAGVYGLYDKTFGLIPMNKNNDKELLQNIIEQ